MGKKRINALRDKGYSITDEDAKKFAISGGDTPFSSTVQELKEIQEATKVTGVAKMTNIYWMSPKELEVYPDEEIRLPLHTGLKKEQLRDTIKQDGVLEPIIVWKNDENKNIILAGHNRAIICQEEGMEVPCIIRSDIDEKAAERIVIVTNLMNRQHKEIVPSVMATLISRLVNQYSSLTLKQDAYDLIEKEYAISERSVLRYMQIARLSKNLLSLVDKGVIPIASACLLSSHLVSNQELLADFINRKNIAKVSANQMKVVMTRAKTEWDDVFLSNALGLVIPEAKKRNSVTVKMKDIENYLDGREVTAKTISRMFVTEHKLREQFASHNIEYSEDLVLKAVEMYLSK